MQEQHYIDEIAALKKEIAEDEELLEAGFNKVNELNLRLALRDSGFTKDSNSKQIKAYEDRISELEEIAGLVAIEELQDTKNELSSYLKKLIHLKSSIAGLRNKKKVRHDEIEDIDLEIVELSDKIACQFTRLILLYNKLKDFKHEEIGEDEIAELFQLIECIPYVISSKNKTIKSMQCEIDRVHRAMEEYTGTTKSLTEMQEELDAKDKIIEAYKQKIAGLEFDLQRQKSS